MQIHFSIVTCVRSRTSGAYYRFNGMRTREGTDTTSMLGKKAYTHNGHLEIAGCDVVELAREMGTPLYIFDEELVRSSMAAYRDELSRVLPECTVAYAGKAFLCSALCGVIEQEGLWLDAVSGGEYYLALANGFPTGRIIFHGNNKLRQEREMVLAEGVGRWVVDGEMELETLLKEAHSYRQGRVPVYLRITPGVDPHTHEFITTGKIDSKFGFPMLDGIAARALQKAVDSGVCDVRGIHCHIGSQIDTLEPFERALEVMVGFMADFRDQTGYVLSELDVGGGLGVPYLDSDRERFPSIADYCRRMGTLLREHCANRDFPLPRLVVEPGRSIVNTAGNTLYRVGTVKDIPGVKRYIAVDGGMTDNPRPILYGAVYQAVLAVKPGEEATDTYSVVGKCCESGDIVINECSLPPVRPGDLLLVEGTGAYNYSMASNYNMMPRPGVVFLREGKAAMVVRPESWYDLVRRDVIPASLTTASGVNCTSKESVE